MVTKGKRKTKKKKVLKRYTNTPPYKPQITSAI